MAPETQELYATAMELCEAVPEENSHFPIRFGWWRLLSADFHTQLVRAGSLLERAVERKDLGVLLQAHHCSWASNFNTGHFARCREHIEAGLAIYHSADYRHHARLYGNHDAKVCAHGILSQLRWMQGSVRVALQEESQALTCAAELGHLGSRVHTLDLTLLHRVYRRDLQEVFDRAGQLLSFTREHGIADHGAAGLVFQGWVIAIREDPLAGLKMLEEGFARQREIVTAEDFPVYLCLLAEALMAAGRAEEAIERIEKERPEFDRIGLAVWMPELLRVLGDTVLAANPKAIGRARKLYSESAAMAAAQNVPMLGLRVAMSEARLALRTGPLAEDAARLAEALKALPEHDHHEFDEACKLASSMHQALGSGSLELR
jgi:predicted ATPase